MQPWKKTLYASWAAQTMAMVGFTFVFPYLPLYIQELGIKDISRIAFWAGILASAPGIVMAISAPIWGGLSDRYGRKIMVERAMFAGGVLLILMGRADSVYQLLILRLLQGALTGTMSASVTLVSSVTPRGNFGFSMGMMQNAVYLGSAIGPLAGGVLSDYMGYRFSFEIAGILLLCAGLLVLLGVRENFVRPARVMENGSGSSRGRPFPGRFISLMVLLFLFQFPIAMSGPFFSLLVQRVMPAGSRVASTAGVMLAAAAAVGAASAVLIGRVGDRTGYRKALAICVFGAAILYVPQALSANAVQLFLSRVAFGLFTGGIMPLINSMVSSIMPRENYGRGYGISSSVSSLGRAGGPFVGGAIASWMNTIVAPFFVSAALLTAAGAYLVTSVVEPEAHRDDRPASG